MARLVVVLRDALSDFARRDAHHRVEVGIVIGIAPENFHTRAFVLSGAGSVPPAPVPPRAAIVEGYRLLCLNSGLDRILSSCRRTASRSSFPLRKTRSNRRGILHQHSPLQHGRYPS